MKSTRALIVSLLVACAFIPTLFAEWIVPLEPPPRPPDPTPRIVLSLVIAAIIALPIIAIVGIVVFYTRNSPRNPSGISPSTSGDITSRPNHPPPLDLPPPSTIPDHIYYYSTGDASKSSGPFTWQDLRQLVEARVVTSANYVFRVGDQQWRPLAAFPEFTR